MSLLALAFALTATSATAAGEPTSNAAELAFDRNGWIYVVREDGTGLRRLVRGSGAAWSPDGERIAYSRFDRLYVANADGTGERQLAAAGRGFGVAWSPDARRITFTSFRSGRLAVYIASADGRGVRRLVAPASRLEESGDAAWSPDGRRIVFASTRAGFFNPELYAATPEGRVLKRLTWTEGGDTVLGDDGMPSFSPNGARIAFSSNRTGSGAIWVMRSDGNLPRKVFDSRADDFDPDFSPDGRSLAFAQEARGSSTLWVMSADGKNARQLGAGGRPDWRPVR